MRFLHTADWQIGMQAAHVGEAGERVREERLRAAERVVAIARGRSVDFLLVAGDIFEDNGVDRVLVQKVGDILARAGCPVVVLPANHDPLVPGSVWEHPVWRRNGITVGDDERPLPVPGGTVFPCPAREKYSRKDPTAWIPARSVDDGIRIGLAHGDVEGGIVEDPEFPIPRDADRRRDLDYLALGHWHSTVRFESDGVCRMAYSGTHEPTKFGESDAGNVLLVEIAAPGDTPSIEPIRTGGLSWRQIGREVRDRGDLAGVREEIESIEDPERVLVDLRLTGVLLADDRRELDVIRDVAGSRFLHVRIRDDELRPAPEDDSWLEGLPAGPVEDAARQILAIARGEANGASSEAASRALLELHAIVSEGGGR